MRIVFDALVSDCSVQAHTQAHATGWEIESNLYSTRKQHTRGKGKRNPKPSFH